MSSSHFAPRLLLCARAARPRVRRAPFVLWSAASKKASPWSYSPASIRHYSIPPQRQPVIDRSRSKVFKSADDAVADVPSGSVILSAGFGLCGTAETLINAMSRRGIESLNNLTMISNNAGVSGKGGLSILAENGQCTKLIMSFVGNNKVLEKKYLSGQLSIELCPQGTLAERIRAAGAGIPAFFTPTATNTFIEEGKIPTRFDAHGKPIEYGNKRETKTFNRRKYIMETSLPGDVAIIRAWKVDRAGNAKFRFATRGFGPIMAKAARLAIVEAEEIVDVGALNPDDIHLPGIFVDRICPASDEKKIEILKTRQASTGSKSASEDASTIRRDRIARRTAKEFKDGYYVNLGVGLPTRSTSFLDPAVKVWLQSENGILGMGDYPLEDEVDPDIVNAGKETITLVPGGSTFDSSDSFGMIRGGHVDVTVLGALQVSANGDLANYMIPGKVFKGMGGAMDLVGNPDETKIVVATEHVAKDGSSKVVQECTLPLTGARCIKTIITDMCVFEVDREHGGLTLTELAPDTTLEDVRAKTDADFKVSDHLALME